MAENTTLARPYAEAVFSLARNSNNLPTWADALARMAAIAQSPQMQECLSNPRINTNQVAQLFLDVAGQLDQEQQNFVRVLIENDRAVQLPEIYDLFMQLKHKFDGVKDAHVYSALALDDGALAKLKADLEARYGKVNVTVSLAPELIGGVRIAVGDEVIDASVKAKLESMAVALQN